MEVTPVFGISRNTPEAGILVQNRTTGTDCTSPTWSILPKFYVPCNHHFREELLGYLELWKYGVCRALQTPRSPLSLHLQQRWYSSLCVSLGSSVWWSQNLYCLSESAVALQEEIYGPDARSCWMLSVVILLDVALRSSLQPEKVHSIATLCAKEETSLARE